MTPEEIAKQIIDMVVLDGAGADVRLVRKIATALRAEREECAKVADVWSKTEPVSGRVAPLIATVTRNTGKRIAELIRARK